MLLNYPIDFKVLGFHDDDNSGRRKEVDWIRVRTVWVPPRGGGWAL